MVHVARLAFSFYNSLASAFFIILLQLCWCAVTAPLNDFKMFLACAILNAPVAKTTAPKGINVHSISDHEGIQIIRTTFFRIPPFQLC